jgi:hypothetical protein
VAQATEGVREQQLGMWAQDTFEREALVQAREAQLAAQAAEFQSTQQGYESAYARAGAESPEERGSVLQTQRMVQLAALGVAVFVAFKVLR